MSVFVVYVQAQESTTGPIFNYKALERGLEKSNEAIENPKKNKDPKTWFSRGELMLDIYSVHNQYLRKGMPENELKILFRDPERIETRTVGQQTLEDYIYERITVTLENGKVVSWVETKKIIDDPLPLAEEAFRKAIELDTEGKLTDKIKEDLAKLKQYYENEGIDAFNSKDYEAAYNDFNNVLKINELPPMKGTVDTLVYYSTGRAAKEAGKNQVAIDMFKKSLELGYDEPFIYVFMNESYKALGDTTDALSILQKGFKEHPDNQSILIELINFYLLRGESKAALEYLALARQDDPENISFIFAEGTIYDKLGRSDDAIKAYKECIDLDPTYFNLGVVYYNKAVKLIEDAVQLPTSKQKEYDAMLDSASVEFNKAIPYMVTAKDIAPDDASKCEVLGTLKTLYYRVKDDAKRQETIDEMTMNGCPTSSSKQE